MSNDPKVIARLLRSMAGGTMARVAGHDVILVAAADLLDLYRKTLETIAGSAADQLQATQARGK